MRLWDALEAKIGKAIRPSNEKTAYERKMARRRARTKGLNPKPPHPHN